jgi:putative addiction module component (TIGR02574 family)
MTLPRDQILEQALALPPEDRVVIADALEESLRSGALVTPEVAAAWAVEIQRRLEEYDLGETEAVSADVFLEEARQSLLEHRARKAQQ